jgi:hypothetical protein
MKNPKILVLLVAMLLFVNYINYWMPDRDKLHKDILLLERKIKKEQELNQKKLDIKSLKLAYDDYFFDAKKYNYSQAMGKFQEMINTSAKDRCKVTHLKWAQVPSSESWYERLKMNLSLECTPKDIFVFINTLRENKKLFYIENFHIVKSRKENLQIRLQLVAYRKHDAKK